MDKPSPGGTDSMENHKATNINYADFRKAFIEKYWSQQVQELVWDHLV